MTSHSGADTSTGGHPRSEFMPGRRWSRDTRWRHHGATSAGTRETVWRVRLRQHWQPADTDDCRHHGHAHRPAGSLLRHFSTTSVVITVSINTYSWVSVCQWVCVWPINSTPCGLSRHVIYSESAWYRSEYTPNSFALTVCLEVILRRKFQIDSSFTWCSDL